MSHIVSSTAPTIEVPADKKSIFRSKALRSYSDREQQSASSTLVTPRSLYLLWALLVLVVFLGVITWLSKIPVYTSAIAVTAEAHSSQNETASDIIVVFVPGDQLNKLRVGQNVVLKLNAAPHKVIAKIFTVEPDLLSPQAAQNRFDPGIQFSNTEPKAVAWARLVAPASSALLLDYGRGSSIDAWVQTDSKPVVSLFPLMGRVVSPLDEQEAIGAIDFSGLVRVSHVRKGELFDRYPLRTLRCLLREKSLQIINQKQNEEGGLYV